TDLAASVLDRTHGFIGHHPFAGWWLRGFAIGHDHECFAIYLHYAADVLGINQSLTSGCHQNACAASRTDYPACDPESAQLATAIRPDYALSAHSGRGAAVYSKYSE